jgi:hypothetical protein
MTPAAKPGPGDAASLTVPDSKSVAPEAVLVRLAGVSGMNLAQRLAAVLGKTDIYIKLLGRLVASHGDDMTNTLIRLVSHRPGCPG